MLENCRSAKERWGGVSNLIDRWLQERQLLLVSYCGAAELSSAGPSPTQVTEICQLLVDYVSAGHFEIYDQLVKEARDFGNEEALTEAEQLIAVIDKTTEYALDFNDKYLETDDLSTITTDLSRLGEVLALRFESEDRMIEVLHTSHKNLVV